jgi:hypothetical protein
VRKTLSRASYETKGLLRMTLLTESTIKPMKWPDR